MKTYVINLQNANDRRQYMIDLLTAYPMLDVEFIDAVDGRIMSQEELEQIFDFSKAIKHCPRIPAPAEIGCTMSHVECYKRMLISGYNAVMILEDDIDKPSKALSSLLPIIEQRISTKVPQIILLSDWYWFTKTEKLTDSYSIATVANAYLTHAYIINKKAAEILTKKKPHHIADNWLYILNLGIQVFALKPHLIQQKWTQDFHSSIQNKSTKHNIVKSLSISYLFQQLSYNIRFLPKRFYLRWLRFFGHYYSPHSNKSNWDKQTSKT